MSLLDTLIFGYRTIVNAAGVTLTRRNEVQFIGSTATDDGTRTVVRLDGAGEVAAPADDIDWSTGGTFTKTLAAGANALTFSNMADGQVIVARITSDAGGSTLTWTNVDEWSGGSPPTQTVTGKDIWTFVRAGGVTSGSVVQDFS